MKPARTIFTETVAKKSISPATNGVGTVPPPRGRFRRDGDVVPGGRGDARGLLRVRGGDVDVEGVRRGERLDERGESRGGDAVVVHDEDVRPRFAPGVILHDAHPRGPVPGRTDGCARVGRVGARPERRARRSRRGARAARVGRGRARETASSGRSCRTRARGRRLSPRQPCRSRGDAGSARIRGARANPRATVCASRPRQLTAADSALARKVAKSSHHPPRRTNRPGTRSIGASAFSHLRRCCSSARSSSSVLRRIGKTLTRIDEHKINTTRAPPPSLSLLHYLPPTTASSTRTIL